MSKQLILVAITLAFCSIFAFANENTIDQELVREYLEEFQQTLSKFDEATLSATLQESGLGRMVRFEYEEDDQVDMVDVAAGPYKPVVQMHGMGDYANNPFGMVPLKKFISSNLGGTYVTNIALGNTTTADMLNTFFMNMDLEVETFARAVRADANLANGFNAIGYSQGNLIIRGYIEKYNNPPVSNWVSVHGPLAGVASFPRCNLTTPFCQAFADLLGELAYIPAIQSILAQANYFRDPLRISAYLAGDRFLADINNERATKNQTYNTNFAKVNHTALVKALEDSMIWPNESEWYGFYQDGSQSEVLSMQQTSWFKDDSFGLQTAFNNNSLSFFTTPGDHLQFSNAFILQMIDAFFRN